VSPCYLGAKETDCFATKGAISGGANSVGCGESYEPTERIERRAKGKRTLRTHSAEFRPAPKVTPKDLVRVRQHLKISRALFAVYLRTNARTLENWEQGRAKPNAQAALLINLVKRFPDTVERLAAI
jgi:putative transcriptional regulator